ncbi:class I SAM-dependent methyltransferase [Bradyrhizobium sp. WSM471]|uniref:class I SAM-dependent methyltransferase n=1 Tax=Bradyrhizobium sp. WSM471 TaxID=319017 RepID=UPI00024D21B0|nr:MULTISPECIES: class I SAM-dependent methyltransferase [Bradyrhizobium]EHR01319.1 methyltransferase family protein [Bradyrhizobium sp. WSM471]UFW43380.1 class I SAM-dependent methyltransferase [Bradyrhizobium canariense]
MSGLPNDEDANQFMYERYVSSGGFGRAPVNENDLAPRLVILRDLVRRFFPADRNAFILDLGCGYGVLLLAARREGYVQLLGVDGSAEQVAIAHRLGISEVRQGDLFAEIEQTAADVLDVVVTYDVIEHLKKQDLLRLVAEVRRVLKPNGRWIIHAPNAESPFFGRIRYGDFTHELAFTQQSLGAVLRAGGFGQVECFEDEPVVHGLKSAVRWMFWNLLRLGLRFFIAVETGETAAGIYSQNLTAVARKL